LVSRGILGWGEGCREAEASTLRARTSDDASVESSTGLPPISTTGSSGCAIGSSRRSRMGTPTWRSQAADERSAATGRGATTESSRSPHGTTAGPATRETWTGDRGAIKTWRSWQEQRDEEIRIRGRAIGPPFSHPLMPATADDWIGGPDGFRSGYRWGDS